MHALRHGALQHGLPRTGRGLSAAAPHTAPGIVFPGSGIFFWWQAGTLTALAQRLDLSRAQFAGASGGALTATLAGCGVTDTQRTLAVALRLCNEAGVLQRGPWALCGVWGAMVRTWLEEVLPEDAHRRCNGRVHIRLHRPLHGGSLVSEFSSRDDLISACLASVHVPLFMDGRLTSTFREQHFVDSDLATVQRGAGQLALPGGAPSVRISRGKDSRLRQKYNRASDFLRLGGVEEIREMVDWGEAHIETLDRANTLWPLDSLRLQV